MALAAAAAGELSEHDRRALGSNIWKFYLFRVLISFQFWLPIWVVYLTKERGLSLQAVTALDAPFFLVLVIMEVPTGAIADRYGRKLSLSLGAVLHAVAILVFAIADNYAILLASYLAWGIAFTLFSGADAAFVFDSLKALGRSHEYSRIIGRGQAAQIGGTFAGTITGAPLAGQTGLVFPIVASAGVMFLAWLVTLWMREPPRLGDGEEPVGYFQGIRLATRIVTRQPELRAFTALMAVLLGSAGVLFIFTQPFLLRHDVEIGNIGWFLLPGQAAGMAAALLAHRVSSRAQLRRALSVAPLLVIFVTGVLGAFDTIWAFAVVPLNSIAVSAAYPLASSYTNSRVGSAQRATVLSLQSLCVSLFSASIEPVAGIVAEFHGLPAGYALVSITAFLLCMPLLMLWLRAESKADPVLSGVEDGQ